jgi:hypothetical protein
MLSADPSGTGSPAQTNNYTLVGSQEIRRTTSDQTVQTVEQITARSKFYQVTYTWFMELITFHSDGVVAAAELKTSEVDLICAHPHVQGFRTEQDFNPSQLLVNFAVIDVGTDDLSAITPVRWEMDQIGEPGVFAAIDKAWTKLVDLGAS